MHELGLQFLRVYDGRFNYHTGHTVSIALYLLSYSMMYACLVRYVISKKDLVSHH